MSIFVDQIQAYIYKYLEPLEASFLVHVGPKWGGGAVG